MIFNNYFATSCKILEGKIDHSPHSENTVYENKKFQNVTEIILN